MRQWTVSCPHEGLLGWQGGCKDVDGIYILQGVVMTLYELDPFDFDDKVTSLPYLGSNQLEARLACDPFWCDNGSPIVYRYSESIGVSAFATIIIEDAGFFGGNCGEDPRPRDF